MTPYMVRLCDLLPPWRRVLPVFEPSTPTPLAPHIANLERTPTMTVHIRVEIVVGDDRSLITTDLPAPMIEEASYEDSSVKPLPVLGYDEIREAAERATARALAGVGIDGGPIEAAVEVDRVEGLLDDALAVLGVTRADRRTSVPHGGIRLVSSHDGSIAHVDLRRALSGDETRALVSAMKELR